MTGPRKALTVLTIAAAATATATSAVFVGRSEAGDKNRCERSRDATPSPCSLLVVEKDGLRCAIYEPGGPNSARLWCVDATPLRPLGTETGTLPPPGLERPWTGAPAAGGGG